MIASLPDGFDRGDLRGYVVTPHTKKKNLRVAFHTDSGVVWEARVKGRKVRDARWLDAPRPLTEPEAARVRAVQTALPAVKAPCEGRTPMNSAVLQAEDSDDLYVYFLTPMQSMDESVFGRHYRARVSADGRELIRSRAFSKGCHVMDLAVMRAQMPRGAKSVGIMTSHLLDPFPQETHVMVSLQHREPVIVAIPPTAQGRAGGATQVFEVDGKRIRPFASR